MKINRIFTFYCVLLCSALQSAGGTGACASDFAISRTIDTYEDKRYGFPPSDVVQILRSNCRRYGVVWSGGIALRFSDRISPRPTRSRWERDSDNHILCADVDWYKQYRVSDQPMLR